MPRSSAFAAALLVALVASGSSVGGASAKTAPLFVRDGQSGPILGSGFVVGPSLEIAVGGAGGELCSDESVGKLTVTGKPKDEIKHEHGEFEDLACDAAGSTATGAIKTLQLTNKGQVTLTASPKFAFAATRCNDAFCTSEFPCVYEVSKLGGSLALPGYIGAGLSGVGKRNSKSSSPLCPKTEEITAIMRLYGDIGPLYAET